MKTRIICACVFMALFPTASFARTSTSSDPTQAVTNSPMIGVWRATDQGLPFVTLTITNEAGSLSGAILFYLHKREAPGQPVTSTPGIPEPLINPKFDGTTLTFQVSHRRAHPPGSLNDPPVSFRLKLTGANAANLVNVSEDATSAGFPIVRTDF